MSVPITGHTRLGGLLGSPVAHSISPMMHNDSFAFHKLDYVYLCFDIREDKLGTTIRALRDMNTYGFNLTMPNKNRMLELLAALMLLVLILLLFQGHDVLDIVVDSRGVHVRGDALFTDNQTTLVNICLKGKEMEMRLIPNALEKIRPEMGKWTYTEYIEKIVAEANGEEEN